MRVIIQPDYEAMSKYTAAYIGMKIRDFEPSPEKPFVLGLPTGSSPIGTYKELARLNKEGKHIQVMTSAAPLRDESGNVIGAVVAAVDVTERKQMELSLKGLTHMYAFLSMANHAIVQSRSGKDLLSDIAGAAVTHGGFRLAWIGEMVASGMTQEPVAIWASDEGNKNRLTDLFYKTEGAKKLAARAHETSNLVIIDAGNQK